MKGKNVFVLPCKKYSCQGIISLINSHAEPTQQAFAVEYGKIFPVFPVGVNKVPIVDYSLGFKNGFWDATSDLKLIARTWHKYPNARIGLALPEDVIVFDCDVLKDDDKRPILIDGLPNIIGLTSFQKLVLDLNIDDIDTLTVRTQSGGRHFYYLMPEGIPSFNHNGALEGLDLKGFGGYVILPNSQGQYGRYEFLNLTEIRPIPESLLKWILQFKGSGSRELKEPEAQEVNDSRISDFANQVLPAWNKAIARHMGNEMRLAIAGTLYHYGWPEAEAERTMKLIIDGSEVKGLSDKNAVQYTYANGRAGRPVYGFSRLKQIIEELEGKQ